MAGEERRHLRAQHLRVLPEARHAAGVPLLGAVVHRHTAAHVERLNLGPARVRVDLQRKLHGRAHTSCQDPRSHATAANMNMHATEPGVLPEGFQDLGAPVDRHSELGFVSGHREGADLARSNQRIDPEANNRRALRQTAPCLGDYHQFLHVVNVDMRTSCQGVPDLTMRLHRRIKNDLLPLEPQPLRMHDLTDARALCTATAVPGPAQHVSQAV
mmetsp:Transcript_48535/g.138732  ORF Transcript_48535/g.138732 Transcript_48535/m.138732 type:complete len:215 (+) Transcript_48535:996-1640(+)